MLHWVKPNGIHTKWRCGEAHTTLPRLQMYRDSIHY